MTVPPTASHFERLRERGIAAGAKVRGHVQPVRQTWTIIKHDGPDHLGLWV